MKWLWYSPLFEYYSNRTRAYFSAATCADSWNSILSIEITPPLFFPRNNSISLSKFIERKSIVKKEFRDYLLINNYLRSVILGLILSDAWMQKKENHHNPRLGFKQSLINFPYFWSVYNLLHTFTSSRPFFNKNSIRGKVHYSLSFQTRQLKSLNFFYNLFYKENQKIISPELYHYFDWIVLAHWIMGDENVSKKNKGIILCTNSFSWKEIIYLHNILLLKLNINSVIYKEKNKLRIYINSFELSKIKSKLKPHFIPHFYYKLNF